MMGPCQPNAQIWPEPAARPLTGSTLASERDLAVIGVTFGGRFSDPFCDPNFWVVIYFIKYTRKVGSLLGVVFRNRFLTQKILFF